MASDQIGSESRTARANFSRVSTGTLSPLATIPSNALAASLADT
jgi:hypothetical protein